LPAQSRIVNANPSFSHSFHIQAIGGNLAANSPQRQTFNVAPMGAKFLKNSPRNRKSIWIFKKHGYLFLADDAGQDTLEKRCSSSSAS